LQLLDKDFIKIMIGNRPKKLYIHPAYNRLSIEEQWHRQAQKPITDKRFVEVTETRDPQKVRLSINFAASSKFYCMFCTVTLLYSFPVGSSSTDATLVHYCD